MLGHFRNTELCIIEVRIVIGDRSLHRFPIWIARKKGRNDALSKPNRVANDERGISVKVGRHPVVDVVTQAEEKIVWDNNRQHNIVVVESQAMPLNIRKRLPVETLLIGRDTKYTADFVIPDGAVMADVIVVACRTYPNIPFMQHWLQELSLSVFYEERARRLNVSCKDARGDRATICEIISDRLARFSEFRKASSNSIFFKKMRKFTHECSVIIDRQQSDQTFVAKFGLIDKDIMKTQGEPIIRATQQVGVRYAGSGKSAMLGVARDAWEREGYNVRGASLSGIAAENLEAG
jgi:hypothetical protein